MRFLFLGLSPAKGGANLGWGLQRNLGFWRCTRLSRYALTGVGDQRGREHRLWEGQTAMISDVPFTDEGVDFDRLVQRAYPEEYQRIFAYAERIREDREATRLGQIHFKLALEELDHVSLRDLFQRLRPSCRERQDESSGGSWFIDVSEVARMLDVKEPTIYRLAERGELPTLKFMGRWHFVKDGHGWFVTDKHEVDESLRRLAERT